MTVMSNIILFGNNWHFAEAIYKCELDNENF
jgi:hypothetical protein